MKGKRIEIIDKKLSQLHTLVRTADPEGMLGRDKAQNIRDSARLLWIAEDLVNDIQEQFEELVDKEIQA